MKILKTAVAGGLMLSVAACASAPQDIQPTYQNSMVYQGQTCAQLAERSAEVAADVERVTGKQLAKRRTDQAAVGVGVVLFWPALFLMLTPDHKRELAQLKGKYEAINRAEEADHCGGAQPVNAVAPVVPNPATTPGVVAPPASELKPATPIPANVPVGKASASASH